MALAMIVKGPSGLGHDSKGPTRTLYQLRLYFNSLTNPNLIGKIDAAGQGHPGLAARLRYRTARLGPLMYIPGMLSRQKHPVEPLALDAGSAGQPKRQELK